MNAVLTRAIQIIRNPDNWTQGATARDASDNELRKTTSESACKWCAVGAIRKAAFELDRSTIPAVRRVTNQLPIGVLNIPEFNDNHTHAEVINLLEQANT